MLVISKLEFDKILLRDTLIENDNSYKQIVKLLEFHKKINLIKYKVDGNLKFFNKSINEYVRELLPDDFKTLKESHFKFKKLIIEHRTDESVITDFFDFLKEKFKTSYINEAAAQPGQQQAQQRKISPQITKYAAGITKELMAALGADADDDEEMAVKAIKKINSKEWLYEVDRMVKGYKRGKAPYSLKDVINSYMSDYNSAQYRAIWQHLGKYGVTGANYNALLAGVGKTVEVAGKVLGKVKDVLIKGGVAKVMKMFRDALDSGVGQAIQILLDETGLGALGVLGAWGIMVNWDVLMLKEQGIIPLAFSILSLLTANAAGPLLKPLKSLFKGPITKFRDFFAMILKSKFGKWLRSWLPKLRAGVTTAISWIKSAVNGIVGFISKVLPSGAQPWIKSLTSGVDSAAKWLQSFVDEIAEAGVSKTIAKKVGNKVAKRFNIPKLVELLDNPKMAEAFVGLDKGAASLIDNYIIKHNGQDRLPEIKDKFCQSKGPSSADCKALTYLEKVSEVKSTVTDIKGAKEHLLSKKGANDAEQFVRGKLNDIKGKESEIAAAYDKLTNQPQKQA